MLDIFKKNKNKKRTINKIWDIYKTIPIYQFHIYTSNKKLYKIDGVYISQWKNKLNVKQFDNEFYIKKEKLINNKDIESHIKPRLIKNDKTFITDNVIYYEKHHQKREEWYIELEGTVEQEKINDNWSTITNNLLNIKNCVKIK